MSKYGSRYQLDLKKAESLGLTMDASAIPLLQAIPETEQEQNSQTVMDSQPLLKTS
jgi:hypothetical protein